MFCIGFRLQSKGVINSFSKQVDYQINYAKLQLIKQTIISFITEYRYITRYGDKRKPMKRTSFIVKKTWEVFDLINPKVNKSTIKQKLID